MKKRAIMLILAGGLILSACGKEKVASDSPVDQATTENTTVEAENASVDSSVSDTSTEVEDSVVDGTSLYQSFLDNKAKVHINSDRDFGSYFSFEKDKDLNYTLEELTNVIIANYIGYNEGTKIELDSIEYSYIDCGNDGKRVLISFNSRFYALGRPPVATQENKKIGQ